MGAYIDTSKKHVIQAFFAVPQFRARTSSPVLNGFKNYLVRYMREIAVCYSLDQKEWLRSMQFV
jgi:hypothetical protein